MKLRSVVLALGSLALAATAWAALQGDGMHGMPGPGEHHEVLKRWEGTWEVKATMAMMPDMEMAAKETNRLVGGMWLISDYEGVSGMPFQGHGITGWDPEKEVYTQVWVDSMSPRLTTLEGTWDAEAGVLETTGEGYDMAGTPSRTRNVTTWKGDDAMSVEMFMGDSLFMTMQYTRVAEADK